MSDTFLSSDEEKIVLGSSSDSSSDEEENVNEEVTTDTTPLPKEPKQKQNYVDISVMDKYDDEEFQKLFRLPKYLVNHIVSLVENDLTYHDNRNHPLSPLMQVLIALRYYAIGSFQIVAAESFGVHQVTCGRITKRVSIAIAKLAKAVIKMPESEDEINKVRSDFYSKFEFPNVLGIVDGTHIVIVSPGGENAEIYRNSEGHFSINTQVVCDANLMFTSIDARWPGSVHDQAVFNFSHLFAKFEEGRYGNGYILGDSAYGCRKYLLTPIQNAITDAQEKYNLSFARTRETVEKAIVAWKQQFPILASKMQVDVNFAVIIIVATAVLHNFAIANKVTIPSTVQIPVQENNDNGVIHRYQNTDTSRRSELIEGFFTS